MSKGIKELAQMTKLMGIDDISMQCYCRFSQVILFSCIIDMIWYISVSYMMIMF